jgi:uncharacterized protein YjbJ (UPF0337 family)
MSNSNFEVLIANLTYDELGNLEDELSIRLDELEGEIASLQGQIEEVWSEYGWYDSETGDSNLNGNAYYYEEKLQEQLGDYEDKLKMAEDQLYDVHARMGKFGV